MKITIDFVKKDSKPMVFTDVVSMYDNLSIVEIITYIHGTVVLQMKNIKEIRVRR